MLNVTKLYDKPGWAYDFIAREMARYSQCKIKSQAWNNFDYKYQDIVIISSPNIDYSTTAIKIPKMCREKGIKVIGQYCGEVDVKYDYADLIVTISPQLYLYAKDKYKNIPVIFLPESVDTNYFQPTDRDIRRFTPGWAGGALKPIKRAHLFEKLNYPVKIMSEHGKDYFKVGRDQEPMKEFYAMIDCFICMSETECMPRVILEAMASGLPVVTTDVGGVHLLVPDEYIIPVYPEEEAIKQMNEKLALLKEDAHLRDGLGRINRAWCEKMWSWEANIELWDEVFYYLKENKINKIMEISNEYMSNPLFKKYFAPTEAYADQISRFNNVKFQEREEISPNEFEHRVSNLILDLKEFDEQYWFAWESCLDIVNHQRIVSHPGKLYFGVQNEKAQKKLLTYLEHMGGDVNCCSVSLRGMQLNVLLEPKINMTKPMTLYGKEVKVPYPVVPYLSTIFGRNWRLR